MGPNGGRELLNTDLMSLQEMHGTSAIKPVASLTCTNPSRGLLKVGYWKHVLWQCKNYMSPVHVCRRHAYIILILREDRALLKDVTCKCTRGMAPVNKHRRHAFPALLHQGMVSYWIHVLCQCKKCMALVHMYRVIGLQTMSAMQWRWCICMVVILNILLQACAR